jgi:uncharacterized coiled-coil protein SlyX
MATDPLTHRLDLLERRFEDQDRVLHKRVDRLGEHLAAQDRTLADIRTDVAVLLARVRSDETVAHEARADRRTHWGNWVLLASAFLGAVAGAIGTILVHH